jgi:hypothetical protein
VYLFRPRSQSIDAPELNQGAFEDILPPLNVSALQPGSAAEWAIGELIIRLCNRGRALRPERPEAPTLE